MKSTPLNFRIAKVLKVPSEVAAVFRVFNVLHVLSRPLRSAVTLVATCVVLTSVTFFAPSLSIAQSDDVLIVEESEASDGGSWQQNFFGSIGTLHSESKDNPRNISAVNIGFDLNSERWQFYLEGSAWRRDVEFVQERVGAPDPNDPRTERPVPITNDTAEVDEAYMSFTPIPQLSIKTGRRKTVWGQFDVFSPVDFILPVELQTTSPTYSKVNFKRAQDGVQISLTPHRRVELQGYYFVSTRVDPLVEDYAREQYGIPKDRLLDHDQQAVRLLFYPEWGTLAFTYYEGRDSFFVNEFATIISDSNDDLIELLNPDLAELTAYAVEFSIPFGRWAFTSELTLRESVSDLHMLSVSNDPDNPTNINDFPANSPNRTYLNWILDQNDGQYYGPTEALFGGLGLQYTADNWTMQFAGYFFEERFTGAAEEGARLSELASGDDATVSGAAPFFNYAYYLSPDKRDFWGFTVGALGTYGAGASAYLVRNIDVIERNNYGNLQVTLGLDVVQYQSDFILSEQNDEDGQWELKEDVIPGLRLGFVWSF